MGLVPRRDRYLRDILIQPQGRAQRLPAAIKAIGLLVGPPDPVQNLSTTNSMKTLIRVDSDSMAGCMSQWQDEKSENDSFIGSPLAERLLARGGRLRALDRVSTGQISNLHPKTIFAQDAAQALDAAPSQAVRTPQEVAFTAARSGEIQTPPGDPNATARHVGFSNRIDLITGLAETLAWTKSKRPFPKAKSATPRLARQENRL